MGTKEWAPCEWPSSHLSPGRCLNLGYDQGLHLDLGALEQPRALVLISVAHIATKGHIDTRGVGGIL